MKSFSAAVNLFLNHAQYSRGLKGAANATKGFASEIQRTFMKMGAGLGIGAGLTELTKTIFEQTKTLESLDFSYQNVLASSDEMAKRQQELATIAEINGVSINELTKQYVGFAAATKDTAIEGDTAMYIFSTMNSVMGKLGSSADANRRALLAVQQMMNKGKVSAEELRQQLGEALPGAFNAFADALGVSQRELDKMLQAGTIISEDALPKFAAQLEKIYGKPERIETLSASVERLKTSVTNAVREIDAGDPFRKLIDGTTEFVNALFGLNEPKEILTDFDKAIINTTEFLKDLWVVAKDTVKEIATVIKDLSDNLGITWLLQKTAGAFKYIFQDGADQVRALTDPLEEYNEVLSKSIKRTEGLFDKLLKLDEGSAEYKGVLEMLAQAEYGIIKAHTDAKTGILNLSGAWQEYYNKMMVIAKDQTLTKKLNELKTAYEATGKSAYDTARYEKLVAETKKAYDSIVVEPLIDREKKPIAKRSNIAEDTDKLIKDAVEKEKAIMNKSLTVVEEGYAARLSLVTKGGADAEALDQATNEKRLKIEVDYWMAVLAIMKRFGGDVEEAELSLAKAKTEATKNALERPQLMKPIDQVKVPIPVPVSPYVSVEDESLATLRQQLNSMVESFSIDMFGSLFETIGQDIAGVDDAWSDFGKDALASVGEFLQSMGAALVTYGWLVKAFQSAFEDPMVALAVGAAAIAAGSVLVGLAKAGPKGMSGGMSGSPVSSNNNTPAQGEDGDNKVVFELRGDVLQGVLDNTKKRKLATR